MKNIIKRTFVKLGGAEILRLINKTPRVLYWHGVDNVNDQNIEAEITDISDFTQHILYLIKNFEIVSIDEFYFRYTKDRLKGREVTLTFDDGYKNNLSIVAPILKKYSIPFTVFISTNNITSGNIFPTSIIRLIVLGSNVKLINIPSLKINQKLNRQKDRLNFADRLNLVIKKSDKSTVDIICNELKKNISNNDYIELLCKYKSVLPLNWNEVKQLMEYDCTIGSHCVDHFLCHNNQLKDDISYQIKQSKKEIENKLNVPCFYFAYPNGDYTEYSNMCVSEANYRLGFSTQREKLNPSKKNLCSLPRIGLPHKIDAFKIFLNQYPKII